MRLLSAPIADRPECIRALNTTFDLASRIGASVKGTHIRPHRNVSSRGKDAEALWSKKSSTSEQQAAREMFEMVAERQGFELASRPRVTPAAYWTERVGDPDKIMAIDGPMTDLQVVTRPPTPGGVADLFLKAALFHSTRPVLLLPPKGRRKVGSNVCIAWNQGPEVSRTVLSLIPVLKAADSVTIVSAGPDDRPGPKAQQLVSYLQLYGIKAQRITTKGRKVETELMETAQEVGADVMISGAYSRARWRETLFGGTTDYLVYQARLPVILQNFG